MDEVAENRTNVEPDPAQTRIDDVSDLYNLEPGAQIEVTRISPSAIKGYVGHIVVPQDGMGDIKEELQGSWGGGTYQLKGKTIRKTGKLQYAPGYARLDIAGYPRDAGKEYINGVWQPIRNVQANPMPIQMPVQSGTNQSGNTTSETLQLLQTVLPLMQGGDLGGVDLPGLITAINNSRGDSAQRDSFSDLERTLAILGKLKNSPLGGAQEAPEPQQSMGFEQMMPMMMMKMFMGGGMPGQPPNPAGFPSNQYGNAQQHAQQPYGPTPQQMWGQQQQQPAPPPPNWTQPPQHGAHFGGPVEPPHTAAQPAPPPQPYVEHPKPPAPASEPSAAADDDEWVPVTPDDVLHELSTRDDAGKLAFLDEFCTKMGLDRQALETMFPQGAPAGPPGGTSENNPNGPESFNRFDLVGPNQFETKD